MRAQPISDIFKKHHPKLDHLDLELLVAHASGKSREFVLAHPEYELTEFQISNLKCHIGRRLNGEPIAYILGRKEFYGLDFLVNRHTLIPRPETELLVDLAICGISNLKFQTPNFFVVDIGTGSGNIIISIAKEIKHHYDLPIGKEESRNPSAMPPRDGMKFFAVDISQKALRVAKKNAALHGLDGKINFLHGSLLDPFIRNSKFEIQNSTLVIVANLPYLSEEIYQSTPTDVKKYEPKSALYSPEQGLGHYRKLLKQIKELQRCGASHISCHMEISPEQKESLAELVSAILPQAGTTFHQDLSQRWRICQISLG